LPGTTAKAIEDALMAVDRLDRTAGAPVRWGKAKGRARLGRPFPFAI
jgi:hypothetical protein